MPSPCWGRRGGHGADRLQSVLPLPRLVIGDVRVPRAAVHRLARRLRRAAQAASVSPEAWATLGVRIVDDAEMARMHVEFMGEAGPTDVMAFPASTSTEVDGDDFEDDFEDDEDDEDDFEDDEEASEDEDDVDDEASEDDDFEYEDDEYDHDDEDDVDAELTASRSFTGRSRALRAHGPLGDVVIDWEQVRRQARDGSQRALVDEATILLVHGLCHLLGHDHRRRGEGRRMHRAELRLLRALRVADVPRPYAPRATQTVSASPQTLDQTLDQTRGQLAQRRRSSHPHGDPGAPVPS